MRKVNLNKIAIFNKLLTNMRASEKQSQQARANWKKDSVYAVGNAALPMAQKIKLPASNKPSIDELIHG